jgi:two-component system, chemotaxis family, protein-glutamate methylesterase/glutaminase
MPGHDIIVVGGSAGGIAALTQLVSDLPPDLPAAILVALHVPTISPSRLPETLDRAGPLPATYAHDGEAIQPGHIYLAPPNQHLLIEAGSIRLVRGPRENGHRPAVDPLFRSAASTFGNRVVGVVLAGITDDGTAGLLAVKTRGGRAVVQDPEETLFPDMPRNAMRYVAVDDVLPAAQIAPLLIRLASTPSKAEAGAVAMAVSNSDGGQREGSWSFSCPECGGPLREGQDGQLLRYHCRVGHAFSGESLLAEQSEALEEVLWSGLRGLEEKAELGHRLARQAREQGYDLTAAYFDEQAQEAEQHSQLLREGPLKTGTSTTKGS